MNPIELQAQYIKDNIKPDKPSGLGLGVVAILAAAAAGWWWYGKSKKTSKKKGGGK